ncbi:hypothetical protein F5H01DRAFT_351702, partial [Linnemannia elongata]
MERATQRFFDIPELVAILTTYLNRKEISRLMQTNRQLHQICTPAHYHSVLADCDTSRNHHPDFEDPIPAPVDSIFRSVDVIRALSKNVHLVRELILNLNDVVYYTNCIFAFQDLASQGASAQHQNRQQHLSRPPWLAPPGPHTCLVLPIPPMTLLTRLEIDTTYIPGVMPCPYCLRSAKDPKASAAYICWILHLNPHLTHVTISGLAFKDVRDLRLVATSIFCLGKLQEVSLAATVWKSPTFARVGPTIFFSCPPSLRSLSLELQEDDISQWSSYYTEEYCRLEPGELLSWERGDEDCRLTTTPRRQGPLQYLTSLNLKEVEEFIPEAELISILQHCPNLLDFGLPDMSETQDAHQLAAAIVEACPALNKLTCRDYSDDPVDGEMMLRIMNLLSPQQVRRLLCDETPFTIPGLDVVSLFKRHSITLQVLFLGGCHNVNSKAIRTLLVECRGLQELTIRWSGERHALCIDLEDAIEFPWRCIRMRTLYLTICIPDEPLYRHLGVEPYYKRLPPIALSAAENSQFEQLEKLYRQIGTLVQVEDLWLGVAFYNLKGSPPLSKDIRLNTFPAMLSLGDERTGRPGYLHHLAGLAKLRKFNGSVSATDETKVTVGLEEAEWMRKHWPTLDFTPIFPLRSGFNDVFRWLGRPPRLNESFESLHNERR